MTSMQQQMGQSPDVKDQRIKQLGDELKERDRRYQQEFDRNQYVLVLYAHKEYHNMYRLYYNMSHIVCFNFNQFLQTIQYNIAVALAM